MCGPLPPALLFKCLSAVSRFAFWPPPSGPPPVPAADGEPPPPCPAFYLTALKRRAGPLVPRVPGYLAAAVIKLGGVVRRLGERRTEPRGRTNEPSRPRKNLRKHFPATTERPSQKAPPYLACPVFVGAAPRPGGGRQFGLPPPALPPCPALKLAAGPGECPRLLFRGLSAWPSSVSGVRLLRGIPRLASRGLDRPLAGAEERYTFLRKFSSRSILCVLLAFCVAAAHIKGETAQKRKEKAAGDTISCIYAIAFSQRW